MSTKPMHMFALCLIAVSPITSSMAMAQDHEDHEGDGRRGEDDEGEHHQYRRNYYQDRGYEYDNQRYYQRCRRSDGTTGLIVGGVAGALLGRQIGRPRHRTTGTIVGAGVGALAGRAIERGGGC